VQPRILDLDGSLPAQTQLSRRLGKATHNLRSWGPKVRLACSFRRFARFEAALTSALGSPHDAGPALSFIGSGDFHHVSLALLRRIECPINLLILDKHPDWMRHIPFLHCGTWVHHAAKLPNVRTIFHVGGDLDFDNSYRWLAPWQGLRSGKIRVISAIRRFQRGAWNCFAFPALRIEPDRVATAARIEHLIAPFREELERLPLYVSLDKDVLSTRDAVVNWDSGHLTLAEACCVLNAFAAAAHHQLAGMDVVGDWSAVRLTGWGRRLLHMTEHPRFAVESGLATLCNQKTNLRLLKWANGLAEESGVRGQESMMTYSTHKSPTTSH
jgi:hypothetical protein